MILEVCAASIESCLEAQKGGAFRVELCSALEVGGLTPSSGLIQQVINYTTLPVHVMIRPRTGDFEYSRRELEVMKRDIENCRIMGAKGVVLGVLTSDFEVDFETTRRLIDAARPLEVTFHRAFDLTPDLNRSAEVIIQAGANRILTSGGAATAEEGTEVIRRLVSDFGSRISIMAGSGVSAESIPGLYEAGIREFHLSGREEIDVSGNPKPEIVDMDYSETDSLKIREAREVIKDLRRNS